jgi:lipoprotein signal peptidase
MKTKKYYITSTLLSIAFTVILIRSGCSNVVAIIFSAICATGVTNIIDEAIEMNNIINKK